MQHHAHVARTAPPHMRAHHMAVPPPHSQPQPHMPPLNVTHAPLSTAGQPPQATQQQQQPQPQQKQQPRLSNGPANAGSAAVIAGSAIGATSHIRDHHARLSQQPLQQQQVQHPQSMHASTQLQKLRQQHQHINSNNNNNSTNKNHYHHHQTQQYNSGSNTHGNALPAQSAIQQQQQQQNQTTQPQHRTSRNTSSAYQHQHQQHPLHHQQQQQQPPPPPPLQQQPHPLAVPQMPPQQALGHLKHQQPLQQTSTQQQQQQQQQLQTTLNIANNVISGHPPPPPPAQHSQQPPTALNYYTAGTAQSNNNNIHKSKYSNNAGGGSTGTGGGGMPPKAILQNPNRVLKARLHSSAAANNIEVPTVGPLVSIEETKNVSKSSSNNNIGNSNAIAVTETPAKAHVASNVAAAVNDGVVVAAAAAAQESLKIVQSTGQTDASFNDANKENGVSRTQSTNITVNEVVSNNPANNNNSNILSNEESAGSKNSKEKTPMCLVNELARFNKITHQYRLTSEKGPAHCKRFTVTLKLGEEEYSAEGFKIKKAQHLAAAEAIEKTKYKHPVPKVVRRNAEGEGHSSRSNITPTVELNALAMKLGEQTYYLLNPRQVTSPDRIGPPPDAMMPPRYGIPLPPPHAFPPGVAGGNMLSQHPPPPHARMMDPAAFVRRNGPYAAPPPPPMHGHAAGGPGMRPRYLTPAQRAFMPKYNQQQRYPLMAPPHMGGAPHNGMVPPPPMPHPHHGPLPHRYGISAALTKVTLVVGKQKFVGLGRTLQQAKHDAAARALQVLKTQARTQISEELNNSIEESDSKSPISLVHEIGIQRSLTVHFKVLREEGPAHMKKFVTACVVGSIVTEGEGNGKKTSKKRAAEKMLEELKKLPPMSPTKSPVRRIKVKTPNKGSASADAAGGVSGKAGSAAGERRKRGSGSIKEKNEVDADAENPITRLIQLQQTRKEKEPIFDLIAKNGNENSRRREFIMEVTAHGMVARGTGNSKKLAKRNAAQNLLTAMGESGSISAENNTVLASSNTEPAVKEQFASATTVVATVTASQEQTTTTVLQPIAEVANAAATTAAPVQAHLDLPLVSTTAGQVPGILILRHNKKHFTKKKEYVPSANCLPAEDREIERAELVVGTAVQTVQPTAVKSNASDIVKGIDVGTAASATPSMTATSAAHTESSNITNTASSTTNSDTTSSSNSASKQTGVHMKDQLLYLANLLGFEVNFSDYPKGNHSEFLTIVTLSSNPPQICHGVGSSAEESQNDAAKNALKILSELGLNNATK
ncbi:maternal effect protein staufen [Anastrepha obliqua]|uniref:maternal effect protein staufen n=1 Tax=Anastrepha obliqua TaxID=95512 RepID=UPI00240A1FB0|nr:maternal effect protein staufen [Anastrepha obliqua]